MWIYHYTLKCLHEIAVSLHFNQHSIYNNEPVGVERNPSSAISSFSINVRKLMILYCSFGNFHSFIY